MKAIYLTPQVEVIAVSNDTMLMKQISGPNGLQNGGQDPGDAIPQ